MRGHIKDDQHQWYVGRTIKAEEERKEGVEILIQYDDESIEYTVYLDPYVDLFVPDESN